MNYISVVKMGRLSNGVQRDHGIIRHAMDENDYFGYGSHNKALCGTKPGRHSVGFVRDPDIKEITCLRCKLKLEKMGNNNEHPDLETEYQEYLAKCRREQKKPVSFPEWLATIAQERIQTDKIYRKQAD